MISVSRSRLSYRDRRSHQKKRFRFLGVLLLVFVVVQLLLVVGVEPFRIDNDSLEPGFPAGTRILVHNYLIRNNDGVLYNSPERGDLVAIHPPYVEELPWFIKVLNPLIRFFTLQKVSLGAAIHDEWANERSFKRVIAVPGDSIRMEDSVAYVMESGGSFYLSEFETGARGYDIQAVSTPDAWDDSMPLSGYFDTITLGEGEYFVMGDNRGSSNDSRYWGAISESDIRGKVVFIYWPIRSFGFPH